MTYQQRKSLGLTLSVADRREAEQLATTIKNRTAETMNDGCWEKADRTPALAAEVHNLVLGNSCAVTPAYMLEQFRRYGDRGMERGGRIWTR